MSQLGQETPVVGDHFYQLMTVMKFKNLFPGFSKISFPEITIAPNFPTLYKPFSATCMRTYHIKNTNFNVFWLLRIEYVINENSSKSWLRIWKRKKSSNSVIVSWNIKKSVKYWVIRLVNTVNPLTQKSYQKYYEKVQNLEFPKKYLSSH